MSILIKPDGIEIYKFKITGVVRLCEEVADFVRRGEAAERNLDLDSARFKESQRTYSVVFKEKKE